MEVASRRPLPSSNTHLSTKRQRTFLNLRPRSLFQSLRNDSTYPTSRVSTSSPTSRFLAHKYADIWVLVLEARLEQADVLKKVSGILTASRTPLLTSPGRRCNQGSRPRLQLRLQ